MDLNTQELFSSLKPAKIECQMLKFKELKTSKWGPQVGMKPISEELNSWCQKENWTTRWLSNSSPSISTPAPPTCQTCSRPSSTMLDSTNCSNTSHKCLYLYWLRPRASWVLRQQTEISHPKLQLSRLKISRTAAWWPKTSESWTVRTTVGLGKALTCLKTLTESSMEGTFQIFSSYLVIKIHKIWRKDKS